MTYWLGIDGGGSNLRVVVTRADLTPVAQTFAETANPSVIGRDAAASRIQLAVQESLSQAGLVCLDLAGVCIGVAGASVAHSEAWLRQVLSPIVPGIPVALSSDLEIALVGANGARYGVLVLAGTGSAAYGVNRAGQSLQVGGWGYWLGDEGGSYWIGMKVLQRLARAADGRGIFPTDLKRQILTALGLSAELDLIPWLYHSDQPRTRAIAQLARLVLDAAAAGLPEALHITNAAAAELTLLCQAVMRELDMVEPSIAFAGGLLENDNILSQRLCDLLELPARPVPQYPPVIGAVLLAQTQVKG